LLNTVDALLTETQSHSFPELSLSLWFERRWGSLYEAFEDGRIDQERLRQVFARYLLQPADGERVWLGIDATSIQRPESKTSPDRTVVYVPNLPESSKPISYGWQFSTVVVLPKQPSSWMAVLDQQRIRSDQTSVEVAAAQLRQLAPLLGCRPIVATDRWYGCAPFSLVTEGSPFDKLLRLKRKRVLYRAAPAPTGKRGAPHKDGERLESGDPSTYGQASGSWQRRQRTAGRDHLVERAASAQVPADRGDGHSRDPPVCQRQEA
jgi:DDE superfamily endonuclease